MDAQAVSFHTEQGLSIVQFLTQGHDSFPYVSAGRAMKSNHIQVKELDQAGNVNRLLVLNLSGQYVFMMDGDILAGAKQNRVVNTSILLAPESKTEIPVSCVESGRWHHVSPGFSPTDYTAPSSLRMDKARQVRVSLKEKRGFTSDQGAIWNMVSGYAEKSKVQSPTSNLSDVYQRKSAEFDAFVASFQCSEAANGLAVFRGRRMLSLDAFNRREVFQEYFPKILRGVALEVYNVREHAEAVGEAEAKYRTLEFFDNFDALPWEQYRAVAAGTERRFDNGKVTGFALEENGQVIHLTALEADQHRNKRPHQNPA
jgi:hypothetical protein